MEYYSDIFYLHEPVCVCASMHMCIEPIQRLMYISQAKRKELS